MSAPFLTALGRTSLSAAVMILAVLALRVRFQGQTPRRVFCLLWDLALVRLLVLADITSPLSIGRLTAGLAAKSETAAVYETAIPQVTMAGGGVVYYSYDTAAVQDCVLAAGTASSAGVSLNWTVILAVLWLAGALLGGLWLLWGHLRSRRLYAASLPVRSAAVADWQALHPLRRPVQVRRSDRIVSPLTYGILYPVVLLPAGMDLADGEVLSCVLTHEYTHIRRFDALRKGLLALALCLHWFNPLVWAMYVLANRDIELACDEAVIRAGADRRSYALALLRLEEERGFLSGSAFSRNVLEERIQAIMKIKKFSLTALVAVLAVMSIATTVFASAAPEEEPEPVSPGGSVQTAVAVSADDTIREGVISKEDENGNTLYSVDGGETWMTEDRFRAEYANGWGGDWFVEWWTAEDYAEWLEQEKNDLQEMIGERGYNPTDGWFTWDQKKVDEAIALYESILEAIQKGALYSKTIVDKDGNTVDDVALGSNGTMVTSFFDEDALTSDNVMIAQSLDLTDIDKVQVKPEEAERRRSDLFQECASFGLTGSEKDGLFYNGQSVRAFVDGCAVGDNGYAVRYSYYDENGAVDIHTARAIVRWADGSFDPSGDLIALVTRGDENFDQGLIDCARSSGGGETAFVQGNDRMLIGMIDSDGHAEASDDVDIPSYMEDLLSGSSVMDALLDMLYGNPEDGRTFEEIFAQYESYGLACEPGTGSFVNLTWNGSPVRAFADLKPDGSAFTYENPFVEEGIKLRTAYDENGDLAGLRPDFSAA